METIPDIPYKFKFEKTPRSTNISTEKIFTFFVRKMYFSGRMSEFLMHNQIGNLIFGDHNSVLLKKVVNEYRTYFEYNGRKKRLNIEKVYKEHPYIWTGKKINKKVFSIDEILNAVNDEITQTRKDQSKKYVRISEINLVSKKDSIYIYTAKVLIENDDFISFSEGLQVQFLQGGNNKRISITILDYNNNNNEVLSFQTSNYLANIKSGKVQMSSLWLLYKQKETIENNTPNNNPIWYLLKNKKFPTPVNFNNEIYLKGLDKSQRESVINALTHDITYIWGPPGTGKSFTLARLLLNLLISNERTIVCAIANVAVDGLLEKTIDLINDYFKNKRIDLFKEKRIIRFGYSQSDKIRDIPQIKLENENLLKISSELQLVYSKLKELENDLIINDERKLLLLSKKDKLKKDYDKEIKKLLDDSNLIFLTSSKFIVENSLHDIEIDNLVIDEGSMMSIPQLLVLGNNVKKRIIISGDFKQLGPISLSNSINAKKWLHNDLFWLLGNSAGNYFKNKSLNMLSEQRRSAKQIIDLVNETFYDNKLNTVPQLNHNNTVNFPPFKGNVIFIDLPTSELNTARFSKNSSKYNSFSRKKIISIIDEILNYHSNIKFNIGIITPYRQQVIDYQRDFEEKGYNNELVKVGTIHTFQGSECDIIIWDIVDTINQPIGSLYKYNTGERLVNVAISRAKSKLIIVGSRRVFQECDGRDSVSTSLKKITSKAFEIHISNLNNR